MIQNENHFGLIWGSVGLFSFGGLWESGELVVLGASPHAYWKWMNQECWQKKLRIRDVQFPDCLERWYRDRSPGHLSPYFEQGRGLLAWDLVPPGKPT
jgi:hypothetical protein